MWLQVREMDAEAAMEAAEGEEREEEAFLEGFLRGVAWVRCPTHASLSVVLKGQACLTLLLAENA